MGRMKEVDLEGQQKACQEQCTHSFIDADNEGCYGKEICRRCGIKQAK